MSRDIKVLAPHELSPSIAIIIGTRPGIIMFAPIIKKLKETQLPYVIIHTGQHYSPNMDTHLFIDLDLPEPEYRLTNVCHHKTHGAQTAEMLKGIEEILLKEKPWLVLVGGDANTNLAGALAARKLGIRVGHIEAGERSYDWRMPEEHNRRIIDHISEYLFATGNKAKQQLEEESIQGKIFITGNTIVDASLMHANIAKKKSTLINQLKLENQSYILFTSHREENVDEKIRLQNILEGVIMIGQQLQLPVIFPAHPRTAKRILEFNLTGLIESCKFLKMIEAASYIDFLNLLIHARLVITDSGGVQQEACIHQIPAITVRENTEWTETLTIQANMLAGTDPHKIFEYAKLSLLKKNNWPIPFGDGFAAKKIVSIISELSPYNTMKMYA